MGEAIGMLESMVIPDAKNAATIGYWPLHMDCIDEATNVTVYLTMMKNDGLLRWHRIGSPATRGFFTLLLSLPHTTAVIQEVGSNTEYAVDSYYRSNGQPPYIVPLSEWRRGWNPTKAVGSTAGLN